MAGSAAASASAVAFFVARFGFAGGLGGGLALVTSAAAAAFLVARLGLAGVRPRLRRRFAAGASASSASRATLSGVSAVSAAAGSSAVASPRRPVGVGRGLGLGDRDVAADVDAPAGQAGGEPGVLALAADGQREHPLGHGHARDPVLLVDVDADDLGRAQRVGHEDAGVVAPRDDVDLLAGQLGDDGLDAARRAGRPWRPTGIEALLARRDGDLGAAAGLAGDGLDLDRAGVDLGDLELEQAAQEALVGAADEDLRTAWSSAGPRARTP